MTVLKRLTPLVFLACACAAAEIQPGRAGDFGIGVIAGAPTGVSAKYWLTGKTAIDAATAWHFGEDERFSLHMDHLWHFNLDGLQVPYGRLPLYVGAGLRVLAGDHSEAGIRLPLGVDYLLNKAPIELFAEIAPVVRFAPDTGADVDGGIGLRYYFR